MACGTRERTRRTPTRPVPEPPTTTVDPGVPLEKGDTLVVPGPPTLDTAVRPSIPGAPDGVARVAMMLPFFADAFSATATALPGDSDWAVEYFAGARLALFDLEAAGQRAVVHVFDSRGDAATAQRLVADADVRASQALVAPYLTAAVRAAATPAKAMGLPLIVPYSAAANLATDYPQLLQLNPGLPTHLDALADYLTRTYDPSQVTLLGLPDGTQDRLVAYLQQRHRALAPEQAPWRAWRLETGEAAMAGLEWTDRFSESGTTVFVFPIYSDPRVINGFMSQLQLARGPRDVELFGLPQWTEMGELDPTALEALGTTVTVGPRVDWDDPRVLAFADRYVERYRALPTLPALLGYDALAYAIPLIVEHGDAWTEHLPPSFDGLASDYRLRPRYDTGGEGAIQRYENTDVEVVRFRNYHWGTEER